MSSLIFTRHAVERYRERVKPAFTYAQAEDELERLVTAFGQEAGRPEFASEAEIGPVERWIMVGDDIALALRGDYVFTCLTRGSLGRPARAYYTRAKRQAQGARKAKGQPDSKPLRRERKAQKTRRRRNDARRAA